MFGRGQDASEGKQKVPKKMVSDIRPAHGVMTGVPKRKIPPRGRTREIFPRPTPAAPKKLSHPRMTRARALILLTPVALIVALVMYFLWSSSLTLVITPKKTIFDIEEPITLTLPAEEFVMSVTKRGESASQAEENFSEKASGTLVVFNNFSSESQVLVKNTRFESPEGLIFRSTDRIVVPGREGGTPGSTEVMVIAAEQGDEYNVGLTDFTIPGFAGSPKYEGFFARSKTEMSGGRVGFGKVVGKAESEQLLATLESQMTQELRDDIEKAIPDDYIAFPDTFQIQTILLATDPPVGLPANEFFGEARGEIRALAVSKETFGDELGKRLFQDQYSEGAYRLREDGLFSLSDAVLDREAKTMSLSIQGRTTYEWLFDADELRERVAGVRNYKDLEGIFDSYTGISRVEQIFQPAVLRRVPGRTSRIFIELRP